MPYFFDKYCMYINNLGTIAGKGEYRTDLITGIQIPLPTLQFPSAETQTDRAMPYK
jgi:hypothetical protein